MTMTNAQAALIAAAIGVGPGALHRDPSEVWELAKKYLVGLDMIDEKMRS